MLPHRRSLLFAMLLAYTTVLSFHRHTMVTSRPFVPIKMSTAVEPPEGTLQSIRSAARMGDAEALETLIADWKKHPILNERRGDILGLAPLHWAVAAGQAKGRNACVQLLIDAGADIETVNNSGNTALIYAASSGKNECVAILVEGGAQIEKTGLYGQNALHVAAIRGDENIVDFLLRKGAKVNAKDENGDTALHLARRFGKEECTTLLLANGADKEMINVAGQKPFDYDAAQISNLSYE